MVTREYLDCLLADLIYHARTKLDKLGKEFCLLSTSPYDKSIQTFPVNTDSIASIPALTTNASSPGSDAEVAKKGKTARPEATFSNPMLNDALQSEKDFDKLYIDIFLNGGDGWRFVPKQNSFL